MAPLEPDPINDADRLLRRVTLLPPENISPAQARLLLAQMQPATADTRLTRPAFPRPFLGLTHLGHTPELIHVSDPELKRVRSADRPDPARIAEEKRQKRIRKNTVEMLLSPEYQRYLKR